MVRLRRIKSNIGDNKRDFINAFFCYLPLLLCYSAILLLILPCVYLFFVCLTLLSVMLKVLMNFCAQVSKI